MAKTLITRSSSEKKQKIYLSPGADQSRYGGLLVFSRHLRSVSADLYTRLICHGSFRRHEWSEIEEMKSNARADFFANDYVGMLESVERIQTCRGLNYATRM